nr:hypothetical protein [Candidatus Sigynarchaeota archaeon]
EKGKIWRNIQEMVSKQVLSNIQQTHCERSKQKIDINQLVNGHDLTAILVKLVCSGRVVKKIGLNPLVQRQYKDYTSLTPRNIDDVLDLFQEIETDLAMAYDSTFFSETGLYKDIIEYEDKINAANTGKPIKFLKRITIS